jgi:uncharacterized BrkB/YihY/UPF0761 family membrane protein
VCRPGERRGAAAGGGSHDQVASALHIVRSGRVAVAVLLVGACGTGVLLFVYSQTMQPAVVHLDSIWEDDATACRRGVWGRPIMGAIAIGTVGSMITTNFGGELALLFAVFLVEMLLE